MIIEPSSIHLLTSAFADVTVDIYLFGEPFKIHLHKSVSQGDIFLRKTLLCGFWSESKKLGYSDKNGVRPKMLGLIDDTVPVDLLLNEI